MDTVMEAGTALPANASGTLRAAQALAGQGDFRGALAIAAEALRGGGPRDPALLSAMVRWRRDGFHTLPRRPRAAGWPPALPDPFPGAQGIPQIAAADLTPGILGGAIQHHGLLRVNGLASPEQAAALQAGIDRAMAGRDAEQAGTPGTDGYYERLAMHDMDGKRHWVEGGGAVWTADSPPMLFDVIELFREKGIIEQIATYMGEPPLLSVAKSTLRRVPVTSKTDWHQDGAFLGRGIKAVNVWLALTQCGVDSPGMDIVAQRLPYIVQTQSHGAYFDWSVGQGIVDVLEQGGAPVLTPEFMPGDALLFDQMMLHRTSVRPHMTKMRWAIESWFFAASDYPLEQVPLLV